MPRDDELNINKLVLNDNDKIGNSGSPSCKIFLNVLVLCELLLYKMYKKFKIQWYQRKKIQ